MKNGEVSLRAAPMLSIESVAIPAGKSQFSRRCLQVVAGIFLGLIIAVPELSRVHSQDARHAPLDQKKTELALAEHDGTPESPQNLSSPKAAKPDIILPDIFIPVSADISAPGGNHAPAPEKRNF
jgi:hypothetical protein